MLNDKFKYNWSKIVHLFSSFGIHLNEKVGRSQDHLVACFLLWSWRKPVALWSISMYQQARNKFSCYGTFYLMATLALEPDALHTWWLTTSMYQQFSNTVVKFTYIKPTKPNHSQYQCFNHNWSFRSRCTLRRYVCDSYSCKKFAGLRCRMDTFVMLLVTV